MSKFKNLFFYLLTMVIFGTNGLLVAQIPSLGGAEIVLLRTLIGGIALLVISLIKRSFDFKALKKDILPLLIGGTALGFNWMLLYIAFRSIGVSLASLIYYCGPIIVLALSPLIFREKLTWNKLLAIGAVAAGVFLISGNIAPGAVSKSGLWVAAGSALFYALVIISNKFIKHMPGFDCATGELVISFVVVFTYLAVTGTRFPILPAADEIIWVVIIGVVNTGLAYYLYFTFMQRLSTQTVALGSYIDPVTALLASALFLGERLAALQILGAVLIIGGACLGELRFGKKTAR